MAAGKEIKRLREKAHISAEKAAELFGVNADRLRKWEQKDLNPREMDALKVESYFGVDLDQLHTLDKFQFVPRETLQETETNNYIAKRRNNKLQAVHSVNEVQPIGTPVYDVPIDASFIERFRDETYFEPRFYINVPKLRNCDFGAVVSGSSMYPIMKSGTIAICRIVEQFDFFEAGEMYFLSTKNGFETVKYVQHTDNKKELLLIPHNEKIKPYTIQKELVLKMCIVEAWLNFR